MINKQNMWFITLFSLIIVLSIYYLTINDNSKLLTETTPTISEVTDVDDSSVLVAMRVTADEELLSKTNELQNTILDSSKTVEEKNTAYETLKNLNVNKGKEKELEDIIKNTFKIDSFVKIDGDKISITISKDTLSTKEANDIIRKIQEQYKVKMYITVKFN